MMSVASDSGRRPIGADLPGELPGTGSKTRAISLSDILHLRDLLALRARSWLSGQAR